jgi:hypothetical protein
VVAQTVLLLLLVMMVAQLQQLTHVEAVQLARKAGVMVAAAAAAEHWASEQGVANCSGRQVLCFTTNSAAATAAEDLATAVSAARNDSCTSDSEGGRRTASAEQA